MEKRLPIWARQLRHERLQRGWSQKEVARRLATHSKTVSRWERGIGGPPRPTYRAQLCVLYSKTAQELGFLGHEDSHYAEQRFLAPERDTALERNTGSPGTMPSSIDWGEAPHIGQLYGREQICSQLETWMRERCRIVAILGTGGIGKTVLAVQAVEQVQHSFDYVIWRSLQHARPLQNILHDYLFFLSDRQQVDLPTDLEDQLSLLITTLRKHRCLLILDNIETILQSGDETGHWRKEHEGFGRFIRRIGESQHQSVLLLTSREKPREIAFAEGALSPVRTIHLTGLNVAEGQAVLQDSGISGTNDVWNKLVALYSGNPLSLKLVAGTIREVFSGDIARFLQEDLPVFGDISDLLSRQFHRLSISEQEVLYWLAVEREAVSLNELRENIVHQASQRTLLRVLASLRRRYMLETTAEASFTLQPVIMAYVTETLIDEMYREIETEDPQLLARHALMKAQARDYIRETQHRLILSPLIQHLQDTFETEEIEAKCRSILKRWRQAAARKSGYVGGNILNLLVQMQRNLSGYDFSSLQIQQAYLQGAQLPDVNFAYAHITKSVFTDTFGSGLSIAFSPDGSLLATGTNSCEIRVWQLPDSSPLFNNKGHAHWVRAVAFHPDGSWLASGSEDRTIRLWDVRTKHCFRVLQRHSSCIFTIAFSPDGRVLADGGEDHNIWLWDVHTGECLRTLTEHRGSVRSVAFHVGGVLLASGSDDHTVRIWDISTGTCIKTLEGHAGTIRSVAFSPDGRLLASGSSDQSVCVWDVQTWEQLGRWWGHSGGVNSVAFNPNGKVLASGSEDQTIQLWDIQTGYSFHCLKGCTNSVTAVAFSPDATTLASGSLDRTVRLWNVTTGRCLNTLTGYTHGILAVVFSPDGHILASGSEDQTIQLWDGESGRQLKTLLGHSSWVWSLAFSPDGKVLASGSEDQTIRVWDVASGKCLAILTGHGSRVGSVCIDPQGWLLASSSNDQSIRIWEMSTGECIKILTGHTSRVEVAAFSPDGSLLASGSEDQTVRIWNPTTGRCIHLFQGHTNRIRTVTFSPDGKILASGGYDQDIRLWDIATGECLAIWQGHTDWIRSVTFSSDGNLLASCSYDRTVRLWQVQTGNCLKVLQGHQDWVRSVAFRADGTVLASGSRDGTIRYWDVRDGSCRKVLRRDRPYERMNLTGVTGLSEAQREVLLTLGARIEEELPDSRASSEREES